MGLRFQNSREIVFEKMRYPYKREGLRTLDSTLDRTLQIPSPHGMILGSSCIELSQAFGDKPIPLGFRALGLTDPKP